MVIDIADFNVLIHDPILSKYMEGMPCYPNENNSFLMQGEMIELRRRTRAVIRDLTWPKKYGDPQTILRKMVSSYLVHHGYSQVLSIKNQWLR